jgi:hypothetical protein
MMLLVSEYFLRSELGKDEKSSPVLLVLLVVPPVLFTAACVLFAAKAAPEHSWAAQSSLFGTREAACLEKAMQGLDQRRHKGGNIDVSYRVLRGMYDKIVRCKPVDRCIVRA